MVNSATFDSNAAIGQEDRNATKVCTHQNQNDVVDVATRPTASRCSPRQKSAAVATSDGETPSDALSQASVASDDKNLTDEVNPSPTEEDNNTLCCSVPLDKVQGVLTTFHPPKCDEPKPRRKLLCLYCERSFASSNLRQKHVERIHSVKKNRRLSSRKQNQITATPCIYCEKLNVSENTMKDLFQHLVNEHSNKYFGCLPCEERFLTNTLLTDHNASRHPSVEIPSKTTVKINDSDEDLLEKEVTVKLTRSRMKPKPESTDNPKKQIIRSKNAKLKELRNKKLTVKSSRIALNRRESKRLQALAKLTEAQKKKRQKPVERKQANPNKSETLPDKAKPTSSSINPYPEFDNFYRVKKITDHSIDNLKISSLTFDDVFDKAFFNRIRCNIEENLLHHIDGKLFKNEESESRISNFEKVSNVQQEIQNSASENFGCELSLNAVTPVAALSLNSQFGEDFESQIEYGSKPSKKKTQTKKDEVHYKYFTRRKFQASILEHKENRDLSKLDMWTQLVIKKRQQKIIDDKKTAKEILEYTTCDEYKNKMRREELNRILDRRGPFEDLREEASKKAALDKLNSASEDSISHESFTEVREVLNEILNRVFAITEETEEMVDQKTNNEITTIAADSEPDLRKIPSFLNLRRSSSLPTDGEIDQSDKITLICSSQDTENFELPTNATRGKNELIELSGEWARCRMYICAACGAKLPNMKYLLDHKTIYHENVWVQHYEFVGNQSELYRHLSIPVLGKVGYIEENVSSKLWKRSDARVCSKCKKQCNSLGELHRHILECGGDWTWMLARKKCKYRYGAKSRRKRRGLLLKLNTKRKTDTTEKKTYKYDGPRQRPSDAETIQRMLANLPAKRSTRKLISLYDGVRRKQKTQEQAKVKQKKVKCGKVIYDKSSNIKETTEKTINTAVPHKKSQMNSQSSNIRSLRSLSRVLSSRILDTNTKLTVKRKLKVLNDRRKTRQSAVKDIKSSKIDEEEDSSQRETRKIKTEKLEISKDVAPKRTSPRGTKMVRKMKLLSGNINIKSFFPVKKRKDKKELKGNSSPQTKDSHTRRKKKSNESEEETKKEEPVMEQKVIKSDKLSNLVRSLSINKKKNSKKASQNKPSEDIAQEIMNPKKSSLTEDLELSRRKRKLKQSFRNVINRVKRLKIDAAPETIQNTISEVTPSSKSPFLDESNGERDPVKIVIPSNIEAKENIADISETAHTVIAFNESNEDSPIPENIFKLDSNNEKNLQAKGEPDFDTQPTIQEKSTTESKPEVTSSSVEIKSKLEPITIETSVKPKIVPMISPNMKGKIRKPARGLNDCIAMLTSKLQQKPLDATAKPTSLNLLPPSNSLKIVTDPSPQIAECILKIPTFKTQNDSIEVALDLSTKSRKKDLDVEPIPKTFVKPIYDRECPWDINKLTSVERIIENVVSNKFQELDNIKVIPHPWNSIDQTIQNVIDGHLLAQQQKPQHLRTSVDDIIDFVIKFSTKDNVNDNLQLKTKEKNRKIGSVRSIKKNEDISRKYDFEENNILDSQSDSIGTAAENLEVGKDPVPVGEPTQNQINSTKEKILRVARKIGQIRKLKQKKNEEDKTLIETNLDQVLNTKEVENKPIVPIVERKVDETIINEDEPYILENKTVASDIFLSSLVKPVEIQFIKKIDEELYDASQTIQNNNNQNLRNFRKKNKDIKTNTLIESEIAIENIENQEEKIEEVIKEPHIKTVPEKINKLKKKSKVIKKKNLVQNDILEIGSTSFTTDEEEKTREEAFHTQDQNIPSVASNNLKISFKTKRKKKGTKKLRFTKRKIRRNFALSADVTVLKNITEDTSVTDSTDITLPTTTSPTNVDKNEDQSLPEVLLTVDSNIDPVVTIKISEPEIVEERINNSISKTVIKKKKKRLNKSGENLKSKVTALILKPAVLSLDSIPKKYPLIEETMTEKEIVDDGDTKTPTTESKLPPEPISTAVNVEKELEKEVEANAKFKLPINLTFKKKTRKGKNMTSLRKKKILALSEDSFLEIKDIEPSLPTSVELNNEENLPETYLAKDCQITNPGPKITDEIANEENTIEDIKIVSGSITTIDVKETETLKSVVESDIKNNKKQKKNTKKLKKLKQNNVSIEEMKNLDHEHIGTVENVEKCNNLTSETLKTLPKERSSSMTDSPSLPDNTNESIEDSLNETKNSSFLEDSSEINTPDSEPSSDNSWKPTRRLKRKSKITKKPVVTEENSKETKDVLKLESKEHESENEGEQSNSEKIRKLPGRKAKSIKKPTSSTNEMSDVESDTKETDKPLILEDIGCVDLGENENQQTEPSEDTSWEVTEKLSNRKPKSVNILNAENEISGPEESSKKENTDIGISIGNENILNPEQSNKTRKPNRKIKLVKQLANDCTEITTDADHETQEYHDTDWEPKSLNKKSRSLKKYTKSFTRSNSFEDKKRRNTKSVDITLEPKIRLKRSTVSLENICTDIEYSVKNDKSDIKAPAKPRFPKNKSNDNPNHLDSSFSNTSEQLSLTEESNDIEQQRLNPFQKLTRSLENLIVEIDNSVVENFSSISTQVNEENIRKRPTSVSLVTLGEGFNLDSKIYPRTLRTSTSLENLNSLDLSADAIQKDKTDDILPPVETEVDDLESKIKAAIKQSIQQNLKPDVTDNFISAEEIISPMETSILHAKLQSPEPSKYFENVNNESVIIEDSLPNKIDETKSDNLNSKVKPIRRRRSKKIAIVKQSLRTLIPDEIISVNKEVDSNVKISKRSKSMKKTKENYISNATEETEIEKSDAVLSSLNHSQTLEKPTVEQYLENVNSFDEYLLVKNEKLNSKIETSKSLDITSAIEQIIANNTEDVESNLDSNIKLKESKKILSKEKLNNNSKNISFINQEVDILNFNIKMSEQIEPLDSVYGIIDDSGFMEQKLFPKTKSITTKESSIPIITNTEIAPQLDEEDSIFEDEIRHVSKRPERSCRIKTKNEIPEENSPIQCAVHQPENGLKRNSYSNNLKTSSNESLSKFNDSLDAEVSKIMGYSEFSSPDRKMTKTKRRSACLKNIFDTSPFTDSSESESAIIQKPKRALRKNKSLKDSSSLFSSEESLNVSDASSNLLDGNFISHKAIRPLRRSKSLKILPSEKGARNEPEPLVSSCISNDSDLVLTESDNKEDSSCIKENDTSDESLHNLEENKSTEIADVKLLEEKIRNAIRTSLLSMSQTENTEDNNFECNSTLTPNVSVNVDTQINESNDQLITNCDSLSTESDTKDLQIEQYDTKDLQIEQSDAKDLPTANSETKDLQIVNTESEDNIDLKDNSVTEESQKPKRSKKQNLNTKLLTEITKNLSETATASSTRTLRKKSVVNYAEIEDIKETNETLEPPPPENTDDIDKPVKDVAEVDKSEFDNESKIEEANKFTEDKKVEDIDVRVKENAYVLKENLSKNTLPETNNGISRKRAKLRAKREKKRIIKNKKSDIPEIEDIIETPTPTLPIISENILTINDTSSEILVPKEVETQKEPIKIIINKQKTRRKSKNIKKAGLKGHNDLFEDFSLVIKKKRRAPIITFSPPDTFSKEDTYPMKIHLAQKALSTDNKEDLDDSVEEMDMELDEIPIKSNIIETPKLDLPITEGDVKDEPKEDELVKTVLRAPKIGSKKKRGRHKKKIATNDNKKAEENTSAIDDLVVNEKTEIPVLKLTLKTNKIENLFSDVVNGVSVNSEKSNHFVLDKDDFSSDDFEVDNSFEDSIISDDLTPKKPSVDADTLFDKLIENTEFIKPLILKKPKKFKKRGGKKSKSQLMLTQLDEETTEGETTESEIENIVNDNKQETNLDTLPESTTSIDTPLESQTPPFEEDKVEEDELNFTKPLLKLSKRGRKKRGRKKSKLHHLTTFETEDLNKDTDINIIDSLTNEISQIDNISKLSSTSSETDTPLYREDATLNKIDNIRKEDIDKIYAFSETEDFELEKPIELPKRLPRKKDNVEKSVELKKDKITSADETKEDPENEIVEAKIEEKPKLNVNSVLELKDKPPSRDSKKKSKVNNTKDTEEQFEFNFGNITELKNTNNSKTSTPEVSANDLEENLEKLDVNSETELKEIIPNEESAEKKDQPSTYEDVEKVVEEKPGLNFSGVFSEEKTPDTKPTKRKSKVMLTIEAEGETKEHGTLPESFGGRKSMRSAKVKALESIHDEALAELTDIEIIKEKKTVRETKATSIDTGSKKSKKQKKNVEHFDISGEVLTNNALQQSETAKVVEQEQASTIAEADIEKSDKDIKKSEKILATFEFPREVLVGSETPLLEDLVAELDGLEELENSIERELNGEINLQQKEDEIKDKILNEESVTQDQQSEGLTAEEHQELRRSRRGSRKVASYNENDLIDPLIDELENKRKGKKKDEKAIQEAKKKKDAEKKLNSEQLFDLLKASTTDTLYVQKQQQTSFLNNLDVSRDINDENFENMFENMLENSTFLTQKKDIDKPYEFTENLHNINPLNEEDSKTKLTKKSKKLDDIESVSISQDSTSESKSKSDKFESNFCEICNKSFVKLENLIKHRRTITHIQKLSEIEAKEAEKSKIISMHEDENSRESVIEPPSLTEFQKTHFKIDDILAASKDNVQSPFVTNHSLKLADIISDVINKPGIEEEPNKFSDIILQNDTKRYKSLGERKSFDSDSVITSESQLTEPFETKTTKTILEKQISLLENIIENQATANYIDDISLSTEKSEIPSEPSSPVMSKPTTENDRFLKPTQYEEISEDSANLRNYDDQKLRKTLNRDEELFLECCSLLKSSSEVSSSYSNKKMHEKVVGALGLKPVDKPEWLEKQHFIETNNTDAVDDYSDNSRIPTPLGNSYDDDASNSNTISSNWGMDKTAGGEREEVDGGVARFNFENITEKQDGDKLGFEGILFDQRSEFIANYNTTSRKSSTDDFSDGSLNDRKIMTKGARKVFEGLKVSIPTEELNLEEVLNYSPKQKKKELTKENLPDEEKLSPSPTKPTRNSRKSKPVKKAQVGSNLLFKINKKKLPSPNIPKDQQDDKSYDVYDFEETQDNTEVFTKPDYKAFRTLKTGQNESETESRDDLDSFVELEPVSSPAAKKSKAQENITKKKCMIMGRIFKNAAAKSKIEDIDEEIRKIPELNNEELIENYVAECKKAINNSEEEIDAVVDQLLEDKQEPEKDQKNYKEPKKADTKKKQTKFKGKKRLRTNSESTDDEFSLSKTSKRKTSRKNAKEEDNCINLEQELKECIGVASRKSQRKCTSGKQNVLVEYWSSDESQFEALLEKQIIEVKPKPAPIEKPVEVPAEVISVTDTSTAPKKTVQKKRPTERKKNKSQEKAADGSSGNRRKRAAVNPLYHWSSSSEDESNDLIEVKPLRDEIEDDEDRPVQHGWIVGDSPKKLVTMLAQAKGKKADIDCVKEQGKKRTNTHTVS